MAGSLKEIQLHRASVFNKIHEIVFHGKGYDYITTYNMPIWLRNFTFNKIKSWYDDESEANSKSKEKTSNNIDFANPDKNKLPSRPFTPPSYGTKVSKKY